MGPDSQGRWPIKVYFSIPILIICCVIFPWGITGHKSVGGSRSHSPAYTEKRNLNKDEISAAGANNIGTLNENGSTSNADSDYVTGEFLRKALINHTLTHGGEEDLDMDLDRLIFSAIPQGHKLVLQSVKVVETDEHGNPLPKHNSKNSPVHWDVKVLNATIKPDLDEEDEAEEEFDENEPAGSGIEGKVYVTPEVKSVQGDLASSGSNSQVNYKAYGTQEREKEKVQKQHHGNDKGKTRKITNTDTDGKTVTNYHGKEDGVKDYEKNKGHNKSDEVERYRDTKKKNKGRRVSGFKRVYHKEEFQRTEHFFDDEDAKSHAESYGIKDKKENDNHGKKDDDRKYHGKKTEYTDGKEIKDEKGTSNGFNQGQHTSYKDSEKHRHNSHYAKSNSHGSPTNYNQNNNQPHEKEHQQQQQYHHPSHNYHGSYSHPKTTVRQNPHYNNYFMNFKPGYLQTHFTPSSNPLDNADTIAVMAKVPLTASFVVTEPQINKHDSSPASSTDDSSTFFEEEIQDSKNSMNSRLDQPNEPDEMKMYFSPRDRNVKDLGPSGHSKHNFNRQPSWNNNLPRTTFRSKIGNVSLERNRNDSSERYSRKYPMGNTLSDPNYGGYSTLIKLNPVNYINLGGEDVAGTSYANNASETVDSSPQEDGAVSDSHAPYETDGISLTSESPIVPYRRPRPPQRGRWISLSLGNPELVKEIQSNPFNRYPHQEDTRLRLPAPTISNIMRGVKHNLRRPGYPSHRYPPPRPRPLLLPHQFDSQGQGHYDASKYPPNVVVKTKPERNGGIKAPINSNKNYSVPNGEIDDSENDNGSIVSGDNPNLQLTKPSSFSQGQGGFYPQGQVVHQQNRIPNRNRIPHSLPPFMNTLMDSVANFFGKVG